MTAEYEIQFLKTLLAKAGDEIKSVTMLGIAVDANGHIILSHISKDPNVNSGPADIETLALLFRAIEYGLSRVDPGALPAVTSDGRDTLTAQEYIQHLRERSSATH